MGSDKYILLTIDVEDWFQVENFKPWIPFSTWGQRELRVEKNTHRLLDLFDSIKSETNQFVNPINSINPINGQTEKVEATFFVLAWIAEKLPHLVREIHFRGHEVASHGCYHQLPDKLSADELKQDLTDSKKLLEDITGAEVVGYRAPSFAVTDGVLKTIENSGYLYDSSYNSFGMHGRYGHLDLSQNETRGIAFKISQIPNPKSQIFYELPISNLQLGGLTFPLGGGGYFRLIPVSVYNSGVKKILRQQDAYVFYAHPWEFDPEQPKVNQASASFKFRHYTNLYKTETRLRNLIESFDHCRFVTCSRYLEETI